MSEVSYNDVKYSNMNVLGPFVLLKKIRTEGDLRMKDGIYVPESKDLENNRIGVGEVLAAGAEAIEKYSVKIGDYVLYDYFSAHGDYPDSVITNAENLIVKIDHDEIKNFI